MISQGYSWATHDHARDRMNEGHALNRKVFTLEKESVGLVSSSWAGSSENGIEIEENLKRGAGISSNFIPGMEKVWESWARCNSLALTKEL